MGTPIVTITPEDPVTITPENAPGTVTGNVADISANPHPEQPYRPFQGGFLDRAESYMGQNLSNMMQHPLDTIKAMAKSATPAQGNTGIPLIDIPKSLYQRFQGDPAAAAGDVGTMALGAAVTGGLSPKPIETPQPRVPLWQQRGATATEPGFNWQGSTPQEVQAQLQRMANRPRTAMAPPETTAEQALDSGYKVVKIGGPKPPAVQGNDPYAGPRVPPMEPAQSTTISHHGYHPDSQTMMVQFKNGKVYSYSGVPKEVFEGYRNSESQGSYFSQNIKGRYTTAFRGTVAAKPTPGQKVTQALRDAAKGPQ